MIVRYTIMPPVADAELVEGYDALLAKDYIDAVYIPLPTALVRNFAAAGIGHQQSHAHF